MSPLPKLHHHDVMVSSSCKNHGIYEYNYNEVVYRSLLLICIHSLVVMVIVVVLVVMVVLVVVVVLVVLVSMARCCSHKVTLKPLVNVEFHELHRCVLIKQSSIVTTANSANHS